MKITLIKKGTKKEIPEKDLMAFIARVNASCAVLRMEFGVEVLGIKRKSKSILGDIEIVYRDSRKESTKTDESVIIKEKK